ncbi:hypothetical protein ACM66B_006103 [Microbotryomycetes sp. NB124-2]
MSTEIPANMQALTTRFLRSAVVKTVPVPKPTAGQALVRVEAVGLNVIDHKAQWTRLGGAIVGCDFGGTIVALGPQSTNNAGSAARQWQIGDRVAGMVYTCSSKENGAFAEYVVSNVETLFQIPDNVSVEAAAPLPLSFITAVLAVEQKLFGWAAENSIQETSPILVYSASTGLGQATVQFIRMISSTRPIVTLSSPSSFELLKSYGATLTLSYRQTDSELEQQLDAAGFGTTGQNPVRLALDCFSEGDSTARCQNLMATGPGRIVRTLPPSGKPRHGIVVDWVYVFTSLNKQVRLLHMSWPARPLDQQIADERLGDLERALADGRFKPMAIEVIPGGLAGINEGLARIKAGKVQGKKLVAKI